MNLSELFAKQYDDLAGRIRLSLFLRRCSLVSLVLMAVSSAGLGLTYVSLASSLACGWYLYSQHRLSVLLVKVDDAAKESRGETE